MNYEAQYNGQPVQAKKVNNRWIVGGDTPETSLNLILIRLKNGGVYHLRGSVLKYHGREF
jgi:hypothetical protein